MKFAIAFSCFGPDVTQTDVLFTAYYLLLIIYCSFAAYWWKRGIHLRPVLPSAIYQLQNVRKTKKISKQKFNLRSKSSTHSLIDRSSSKKI